MEIPVFNRISDFEAGIISSLKNPSLLSQIYGLYGIEKIYQVEAYSFWKWGALILALLASLSTIINRLKILIIRFRPHHSLPNFQQPLLYGFDFETDSQTDTDTETDIDSSCSSSHDEREYYEQVDEDFRVRGSGPNFIDDQWQNSKFTLRRRRGSSNGDVFSWAEELTTGESDVVKLWENLGLDNVNKNNSVLNVYDVSKGTKLKSIKFGGKSGFQPAVLAASSASSPAVVLSAGINSSSQRVAVSAWETRLPCCGLPDILAEWTPRQSLEKIAAVIADGVGKVYIMEDVPRKLTVGDLRKVSSPLRNLTESDVDTGWNADTAIVSEESM